MDCLIVMCLDDCFSCLKPLMAYSLIHSLLSYLIIDYHTSLEVQSEDSDTRRIGDVIVNNY
jgi:hypothetical protein